LGRCDSAPSGVTRLSCDLFFLLVYDLCYQIQNKGVNNGINPFIALHCGIHNMIFFKHRQVLANDGLAFAEAGPEVGHTGFSLVVNKAEKLKPDRVAADLEFPGNFFDHIIGAYFLITHNGNMMT
jgi:hypothetical protein